MAKTMNWTINMRDVEQGKSDVQREEEWQISRLKMMFKEFYLDLQASGLHSQDIPLQEVEEFISKWTKFHFQY